MNIAIVAPSVWYPIVPQSMSKYGGAEKVVSWLTEKLIELGHNVTLFAPGDSITSARLIPTCECSVFGQNEKATVHWEGITDNLLTLGKAMEMAAKEGFDIIHSHIYGDVLITSSARSFGAKVISTVHNSLCIKDMGLRNIIPYRAARNRDNHKFIALSRSHAKCNDTGLPIMDIINNGVELSDYKIGKNPKKKNDTFLCLSRIDPLKGIGFAINAAQKAGVKLIIAGRILAGSSEEKYFRDVIEPRLEKGVLEYAGEVSAEKKITLFRRCQALLFPATWREPCPVTPMEAGACSTPVITSGWGSLPEIVEDGISGFVVSLQKYGKPSIKELVQSIKRIDEIEPINCLKHIQNNFTADIMARNYLKCYQKIAGTSVA